MTVARNTVPSLKHHTLVRYVVGLLLLTATFAAFFFTTNSTARAYTPYSLELLTQAGLRDQSGQKIKAGHFKDKVVLVNFFFTSCGNACPLQTSVLREVQSQLDPSLELAIVSVSLSPIVDTQQAIEDYINKFNISLHNWQFAKTNPENTHNLVDNFRLLAEAVADSDDPINHRNMGFLFSGDGMLMQQYQLRPSVKQRLVQEITALEQLSTS